MSTLTGVRATDGNKETMKGLLSEWQVTVKGALAVSMRQWSLLKQSEIHLQWKGRFTKTEEKGEPVEAEDKFRESNDHIELCQM